MPFEYNYRSAARWLGATLAAAGTTAVLVWLHADPTTAGLVFLVLVVWTATQSGISISIYSSVLCALAFDYFFLPPYHTLRLAGSAEWVAFLSFIASSVAAGRVAERARNQARQAEQRREDMERLYALGQEMLLHEDASALRRELPGIIARIFGLEVAVLYVNDTDSCYASTSDLPMSIQASLSAMGTAQGAILALPGEIEATPLMVGMRSVGALGWRPPTLPGRWPRPLPRR